MIVNNKAWIDKELQAIVRLTHQKLGPAGLARLRGRLLGIVDRLAERGYDHNQPAVIIRSPHQLFSGIHRQPPVHLKPHIARRNGRWCVANRADIWPHNCLPFRELSAADRWCYEANRQDGVTP